MAKYNYPYSAVGGPPHRAGFRPMVDAVLTTQNGKSLQWAGLADSGADCCLFPLDVAMILGLDLKSLRTASTRGVGNAANLTYYDTLTIDLGNSIRFATVAGFIEGMDRAGFGLLGQQGFFENYTVEFRHRDRIFTIEAA